MKLIRVVIVICLLAVCVCATPRAAADERNNIAQVASMETVEGPGMTPVPGGDGLAQMDRDSDRHLMLIWNTHKTNLF